MTIKAVRVGDDQDAYTLREGEYSFWTRYDVALWCLSVPGGHIVVLPSCSVTIAGGRIAAVDDLSMCAQIGTLTSHFLRNGSWELRDNGHAVSIQEIRKES